MRRSSWRWGHPYNQPPFAYWLCLVGMGAGVVGGVPDMCPEAPLFQTQGTGPQAPQVPAVGRLMRIGPVVAVAFTIDPIPSRTALVGGGVDVLRSWPRGGGGGRRLPGLVSWTPWSKSVGPQSPVHRATPSPESGTGRGSRSQQENKRPARDERKPRAYSS